MRPCRWRDSGRLQPCHALAKVEQVDAELLAEPIALQGCGSLGCADLYEESRRHSQHDSAVTDAFHAQRH
jgi:hypothetical protein